MKWDTALAAVGGAITAATGAFLSVGEKGVEVMTENPEILTGVGALAGQPWVGPAILAGAGLIRFARKQIERGNDEHQ